MVPAPIERSEVWGHDNRSENLQHLQRRRLLSLAQRCGGCGTERSSEFGSVNRHRCPHARARRATIPGSSEADRPARAAWSALRLLVDVVIFVLAKLLVGRFWFGAGDGAQAVAADVGFAGSDSDGAGADRAQGGTGA